MLSMSGKSIHIRWMIRRDRDDVLDIERQSFESPWSEEDFIQCLRQRSVIGMVAVPGSLEPNNEGPILGYMIYELQKTKLALLNFAVHPEVRKQGIGRSLIERLASKLSASRRNKITLEVADWNLGAQLFFRACGFKAITVFRNFYEDGTDAYLMQRLCGGRDPRPIKGNRIRAAMIEEDLG